MWIIIFGFFLHPRHTLLSPDDPACKIDSTSFLCRRRTGFGSKMCYFFRNSAHKIQYDCARLFLLSHLCTCYLAHLRPFHALLPPIISPGPHDAIIHIDYTKADHLLFRWKLYIWPWILVSLISLKPLLLSLPQTNCSRVPWCPSRFSQVDTTFLSPLTCSIPKLQLYLWLVAPRQVLIPHGSPNIQQTPASSSKQISPSSLYPLKLVD